MERMRKVSRRTALKLQAGVALVVAVGGVQGVATSVASAAEDAPGELIVQPAAGATIEQVNARFGTRTLLRLTGTSQALVSAPAARATLARMAADRAVVAWAEPNAAAGDPRASDDSGADGACPPPPPGMLAGGVGAQDDSGADGQRCTRVVDNGPELYRAQYAVARIRLDRLRAATDATGAGVTVAVLDTVVDAAHPALGGVLPVVDLVPTSPATDVPTTGRAAGHGTFVAGLVARTAPAARILPIRVLNEDGLGSTALVAEGIRRAAAAGARVVNLSLSAHEPSRALRDAVEFARARDVVLVAAYGDGAERRPSVFPADYPAVLGVAATDDRDVRASFSTGRRPVSVAAPGVNVVSAYVDGAYAVGSGSSYAAPWVAGTAALVLQARPTLPPGAVAALLARTAADVSSVNQVRTTRLDAYRALTAR